MSKEKGMSFTTESIQAILSGAKTQTRRVLSPQPVLSEQVSVNGDRWWWWERGKYGKPYAWHENSPPCEFMIAEKFFPVHTSDTLYVKETYVTGIEGCPNIGDYQGVTYRADHRDPRGDGPAHPIKWRSSMFMPKALARTWLEVLAVRVERLQDISEEDARAEGVVPWEAATEKLREIDKQVSARHGWSYPRYRNSFREAWDKVNAKRGYSWESSPWVAVYTFRRIER